MLLETQKENNLDLRATTIQKVVNEKIHYEMENMITKNKKPRK